MYSLENSKTKSKFQSKSKSKSKSNDPFYPTFSSSSSSTSFLKKFNKSPKTHSSKSHQYEHNSNNSFTSSTTIKTPKNRANAIEDEKMSSLRRACLVEKWMEQKVNDKVTKKSNNSKSSSTLLEEFDMHDALFSTTTSTSSNETDYPVFSHHKQKSFATHPPPLPKPIKTNLIESKFLNQFSHDNEEEFIKNRSRAAEVYSNLKTLKQPISPGVRLTSFINSLFTKQGKSSTKISTKGSKHKKTEQTTTTTSSTCSSAPSFSRSSCLISKNKKFKYDGTKRTVRFCPVSVIVDDDSQPCGYKSLQEESDNLLLNTEFKRSLSKRYQELKKLNGLERNIDDQKKLEEVALDLLSGYWDAKLNKPRDLSSKVIMGTYKNDYGDNVTTIQYTPTEDYSDNRGVNYSPHGNDNDDEFSCSSSDLFELDHLSLIGDELPVYETTQFSNKIK